MMATANFCAVHVPCLFKMDNFGQQGSSSFKIDQAAQKTFVENYIFQKTISQTLRAISITLASTGVYYAIIGGAPLFSLYLAAAALISHLLERMRENDPKQLALSSFRAVADDNGPLAIKYIQKGADLDFVNSPKFSSHPPHNLFDYAATKDKTTVLTHLASIGFQFKRISQGPDIKNTSTLQRMGEVSMDTMRHLVDRLHMPVNNPNEWRSSPLFVQAAYLKKLATENAPNEKLIKTQAKIVKFLSDKGAQFQNQDGLDGNRKVFFENLVNQAVNLPSKQTQDAALDALITFCKNAL